MKDKILITGATGQLGRLVIESLLKKLPAQQLIAGVRSIDKAADLKEQGIDVRVADYNRPETFTTALQGVDKVLLISSSEVGQRLPQHKTVIDAAKEAGVKLLAYTSLLHADSSPLKLLADEHWPTEQALQASGVPFVILRNGWYTENYAASVPAAIANSALFGAAGDGRISSAARQDYADAAAEVLVKDISTVAGETFELAGDESYTLADLAAEISKQTGKEIPYNNLPEQDYGQALQSAGLPEPIAQLLAVSDTAAAAGALFDDSGVLSQLLGRKTTPLAEVVTDFIEA